MGRIIAHSGSQGCGKTYAMHEQVCEMMRQFPTLKVDTVSGVVRRVSKTHQINRESTGESQLLIFTNMISEMIEKSRFSDIVMCDRSIYDVIAYTAVAAKDFRLAGWMTDLCHHKNFYTTVYFHQIRDNEFCYADGLRDTCQVFRAEIDRWLAKFYQEHNVPVILWRSVR